MRHSPLTRKGAAVTSANLVPSEQEIDCALQKHADHRVFVLGQACSDDILALGIIRGVHYGDNESRECISRLLIEVRSSNHTFDYRFVECISRLLLDRHTIFPPLDPHDRLQITNGRTGIEKLDRKEFLLVEHDCRVKQCVGF